MAALLLRQSHSGVRPTTRPDGLGDLAQALAALERPGGQDVATGADVGTPTPAVMASQVMAPAAARAPSDDVAATPPEAEPGATGEAPSPGRIAAYRQAVLRAAEAAESQALADAALEAHGGAEPSAAEILALMDMVGSAGTWENRGAEFAALREAYDAAIQSEAAAGAERDALRGAAESAGAESASALAAIAPALTAVVGGRDLSPDVLAELHRLLGIEDEVRALGLDDEIGTLLSSARGSR